MAWRVARPAEISYAEIRHASRALGETKRSLKKTKKRKKGKGQLLTVSVGERSRQLGPFEEDRFQYGTRPCLMTLKLVRPTERYPSPTRHHSIFRNTS